MQIIHIKELLKDIISGQPRVSKMVAESDAADLWCKVVSEETLKHTEPLKVKEGTMYVLVTNSAWAQEISMQKNEILEKINNFLGKGEVLKDIRFKTGLVRRR